MATLMLRGIAPDLFARVEAAARRYGRTTEEEVLALLERRYARRDLLLERLRARWNTFPVPKAEEVDGWIEMGRR